MPDQPIIRANSAMLLCGSSGSGKSSLIATYADWVWKNFKKVTLLYSNDGGGFPDLVLTRIRNGIIWVWRMGTRGHPFETFARATTGWWPEKIDNPMTGEAGPSCKLVAPVTTVVKMFCPCGQEVRRGMDRKQVALTIKCKCGTLVNAKNARFTTDSVRTPGFEMVGGAAFDGLTSMQFDIMLDMSERHGVGELEGSKAAIGGKIIDGDIALGGNNMSHYGFAQLRAQEWITKSTTIPGLVAPPIWTALERQADDTTTNLPVYGPKVAGKAVTSDVPQWVGDCLGTYQHVETDEKKKVTRQYRLYLREYRLRDTIPHLCKTRVLPQYIEEDYLCDGPDDEPFTKFNLGYYFDLVSAALQKAVDKIDKQFPDAPGLPPGGIGNGGEGQDNKEDRPSLGDSDEPTPQASQKQKTTLPPPKASPPRPSPGGQPTRRPLRARPNNN